MKYIMPVMIFYSGVNMIYTYSIVRYNSLQNNRNILMKQIKFDKH